MEDLSGTYKDIRSSKEDEILAHRGWHSRRTRPLLRCISLTVASIFFLQQIVFAQGEGRITASSPITNHRLNLNQVSIPRDIAITKDVNKTDSDKMIINIKDVHDNYGAQESIVEVLDNLLVNYDIRFIGIEGSEGDIDTSLISAFPDDDSKKLVADYLMREGKISAGEFFAATSKTPITLYGIDDSGLYLKNYDSFLNLLEFREQNLKYVDILRRVLSALEDHIFSEDLKLLNRNSVLNGNGGKRFTRRWDCVRELGEKHGVGLKAYPNITALMRAVEMEKTIDYDAVNEDRDSLLDHLTARLDRDLLEELVLKSLAFKLEKISRSQFYTYLLILAKAEKVDRAYYANIEKFSEYVSLYESIDIGQLMDEIDAYEERIREKLFRNADEERLTRLIKDTEILRNLYEVKLTSGQLKYLMSNVDNIKTSVFLDFIKSRYRKYGLVIPGDLSGSTVIFDRLPKAIEFYRAATSRNRKMVENTIERMGKDNVNVGAVITGGFHTRGITDILKTDNVSYLILLPRFNNKYGKRPYVTILTNKHNEYKHYVDSGDYLAITSYFAESIRILQGTGMERTRAEMYLRTAMGLLGAMVIEKGSRGVERFERVKRLYLEGLEGTRDYDLIKNALDENNFRVNITGENKVEIYVQNDMAGVLKYDMTLEETDDGKNRKLTMEITDNVSRQVFKDVQFIATVRTAKDIADMARTQAAELSEQVKNLQIEKLTAKLGSSKRLARDLRKAREEGGDINGIFQKEIQRISRVLQIDPAVSDDFHETEGGRMLLARIMGEISGRPSAAEEEDETDTTTASTGEKKAVTREDHERYHAQHRAILRLIGEEVCDGSEYNEEAGEYDLRKAVRRNNGRIDITRDDGSRTVIYETEDGILAVIDSRFHAGHAGRGRLAAYANSGSQLAHEVEELRGWIKFALGRGIITEKEINEGKLGTRLQDYMNGRMDGDQQECEDRNITSRELRAEREREIRLENRKLHLAGLQAELGSIEDELSKMRRGVSETDADYVLLDQESKRIKGDMVSARDGLKEEIITSLEQSLDLDFIISAETPGEEVSLPSEGLSGEAADLGRAMDAVLQSVEDAENTVNKVRMLFDPRLEEEMMKREQELLRAMQLAKDRIDGTRAPLADLKERVGLLEDGPARDYLTGRAAALENRLAKLDETLGEEPAVSAEEQPAETVTAAVSAGLPGKPPPKPSAPQAPGGPGGAVTGEDNVEQHAVRQASRRLTDYDSLRARMERRAKKKKLLEIKRKFEALSEEEQRSQRAAFEAEVKGLIDTMDRMAEEMADADDPRLESMGAEIDLEIERCEENIGLIKKNIEYMDNAETRGHGVATPEERKNVEEELAAREAELEGMKRIRESGKDLALKVLMRENEERLVEMMNGLMDRLDAGDDVGDDYDEFMRLAACNVSLSMRMVNTFTLREHQIQSVQFTARGLVINLSTGQGKTYVDILDRYIASLRNDGAPVDLMAKDDGEARRLEYKLGMAFRLLDKSCDFISGEQGMDYDGTLFNGDLIERDAAGSLTDEGRRQKEAILLERRRKASGANIRFITHHIGFAFLHDLDISDKEASQRYLRRGFYDIAIDEVDSLILDQALSELIISVVEGTLPLKKAMPFYVAHKITQWIQQNAHRTMLESTYLEEKTKLKEKEATTGVWVVYDSVHHRARLTGEGEAELGKLVRMAEKELEAAGFTYEGDERPSWEKLVNDSLHVLVQRGAFYWGEDPDTKDWGARLIDQATGTDAQGRKWQDGLDEALNVMLGKFGIKRSGRTQSKISMYELINILYAGNFTGFSGTMVQAESELLESYGKPVVNIPDFEEGLLRKITHRHIREGTKFREMMREVCNVRKDDGVLPDRPMVIMISDFEDYKRFAGKLRLIIYMAKGDTDMVSEIEGKMPSDDIQEVRTIFGGLSSMERSALARQDMEKFQMLSADNEKMRTTVESRAGGLGYLTISTNIMGRASDVQIESIMSAWKRLSDNGRKDANDPEDGLLIAIATVLSGARKGTSYYEEALSLLEGAGIDADIEELQVLLSELDNKKNDDGLRSNTGENTAREEKMDRLTEILLGLDEEISLAMGSGYTDELRRKLAELRQRILLGYIKGMLFLAEREELIRVEKQKEGRPAREGKPGEMIFFNEIGRNTNERWTVTKAFYNRTHRARGSIFGMRYETRRKKGMKKLRGLMSEREKEISSGNFKKVDLLNKQIAEAMEEVAELVSMGGTLIEFEDIQRKWNTIKDAVDSAGTDAERTRLEAELEDLELEWQVFYKAAQKRIENINARIRRNNNKFSTLKSLIKFKERQRSVFEGDQEMMLFMENMYGYEAREIVQSVFKGRMWKYRFNIGKAREKALKRLREVLRAQYRMTIPADFGFQDILNMLWKADRDKLGDKAPSSPKKASRITKKDIERFLKLFFISRIEADEQILKKSISAVYETVLGNERKKRNISWLAPFRLQGVGWRVWMWWQRFTKYRTNKRLAKSAAHQHILFEQSRFREMEDEKAVRRKMEVAKDDGIISEASEQAYVEAVLADIELKMSQRAMRDARSAQETGEGEETAEPAVEEDRYIYQQGKRLRMRKTQRFESLAPRPAETTTSRTVLEQPEEEEVRDIDRADVLGEDGQWQRDVEQTDIIERRVGEEAVYADMIDTRREEIAERKKALEDNSERRVVRDPSGREREVNVVIMPEGVKGDGLAAAGQALSVAPPDPDGDPPVPQIILAGTAARYYEDETDDDARSGVLAEIVSSMDEDDVPSGYKRIIVIEEINPVESKGGDGPKRSHYVKYRTMSVRRETAERLARTWSEWTDENGFGGLEDTEKAFDGMLGTDKGFVTLFGRRFFSLPSHEETLDNGSITTGSLYEVPAPEDPAYSRFMQGLIDLETKGRQAFRDYESRKKLGTKTKVSDEMLTTPRWRPLKRRAEKQRMQDMMDKRQADPEMDIVLADPFMRRLVYMDGPLSISFSRQGTVRIGNREFDGDNFREETGYEYPGIIDHEVKMANVWDMMLAGLMEDTKHPVRSTLALLSLVFGRGLVFELPKYLVYTLLWKKLLQRFVLEKPRFDKEEAGRYYQPAQFSGVDIDAGIPPSPDDIDDFGLYIGVVFTDDEKDELLDSRSNTVFYRKIAETVRSKAGKTDRENRRNRLLGVSRDLAMMSYVLSGDDRGRDREALRLLALIAGDTGDNDMVIKYGRKAVKTGFSWLRTLFLMMPLTGLNNRLKNRLLADPEENQKVLTALYKAYKEKGKYWRRAGIRKRMNGKTLARKDVIDMFTGEKPLEEAPRPQAKPEGRLSGLKKFMADQYDKSFITRRIVKRYKAVLSFAAVPHLAYWLLTRFFGLQMAKIAFFMLLAKIVIAAAAVVLALDFIVLPVSRGVWALYKNSEPRRARGQAEASRPLTTRSAVYQYEFYKDPQKGNNPEKAERVLKKHERDLERGRDRVLRPLVFLLRFIGIEALFDRNRMIELAALAEFYLTVYGDKEEGRKRAARIIRFIDSRAGNRIINKAKDEGLRDRIGFLRVLLLFEEGSEIALEEAEEITGRMFDDDGRLAGDDLDIPTLELLGRVLAAMRRSDKTDRDEKTGVDTRMQSLIERLRSLRGGFLPDEGSITDGDSNVIGSKSDMTFADVSEDRLEDFIDLERMIAFLLKRGEDKDLEDSEKDAEKTMEDAEKSMDRVDAEKAVAVPDKEKEKAEREKVKRDIYQIRERIRRLKRGLKSEKDPDKRGRTRGEIASLYLDLAAAYAEKDKEQKGFWKRVWLKITFRGYPGRRFRSLKRAVAWSVREDGSFTDNGTAYMRLMAFFIEKGKIQARRLARYKSGRISFFGLRMLGLTKFSLLASNINEMLDMLKGFEGKLVSGEELSDDEKELMDLTFRNLRAAVDVLAGKRRARNMDRIWSKGLKRLSEGIVAVMEAFEDYDLSGGPAGDIKKMLEEKLEKDTGVIKAFFRERVKSGIRIWFLSRELVKKQRELNAKQSDYRTRGRDLSGLKGLRDEIDRLENNINDLKLDLMNSRARRAAGKGLDNDRIWLLIGDTVREILQVLKKNGVIYLPLDGKDDKDSFRKWIQGKIDGRLPAAVRDVIIEMFVAEWVRENQKTKSAKELGEMRDGDAKRTERKRRGITSGQIKGSFIDRITDPGTPPGIKKELYGICIALLGGIITSGSLVDILSYVDDKLKTDPDNYYLLSVKRVLLEKLYIEPARKISDERYAKTGKAGDKLVNISPGRLKEYTDTCLAMMVHSLASEEAQSLWNDMLKPLLPRLTSYQRSRLIKELLEKAKTGEPRFEIFLEEGRLREFYDLAGTSAAKREFLEELIIYAVSIDNNDLMKTALRLAQDFIGVGITDKGGNVQRSRAARLNDFIVFLIDQAGNDHDRLIEIFDLLKTAAGDLRRAEKYHNLAVIAGIFDDVRRTIGLSDLSDDTGISVRERDRYMSALYNLYIAIDETQGDIDKKREKMDPASSELSEFNAAVSELQIKLDGCRVNLEGTIKNKLTGIRKQIFSEKRTAYKRRLRDAGEAYRMEADALAAAGDLEGAVGAAEKSIERMKKIIGTGRKHGDISGRGGTDEEFAGLVNDEILRTYRNIIAWLRKLGKDEDAFQKQHDMHMWSYANANHFTVDPGSDLVAAERAMDLLKRKNPGKAKTEKDAADSRLISYKKAREEAGEARKKLRELRKKKDGIRAKYRKAEVEIEGDEDTEGLKKKIENQEEVVDGLSEDIARLGETISGEEEGTEKFFNLRVERIMKRRKLSAEKAKLKELRKELEKKGSELESLKKEEEEAQREIEEHNKELEKLEKKEEEERRIAAEPVKFHGEKDSFHRSKEDYMRTVQNAEESESSLADEAIDGLVGLCEEGVNSPALAGGILDDIEDALDGLDGKVESRKRRRMIRKRLEKAKIKICEMLLAAGEDKAEGRKRLGDILNAHPGRSVQTVGIPAGEGARQVKIDTRELFEYLTEEDSIETLGYLISVIRANTGDLLGILARRELIRRIYDVNAMADMESIPPDEVILEKFARIIVEKDEEKREKEPGEEEEPESELARDVRVDGRIGELVTELQGLGLTRLIDMIRGKHQTDKPWEKMADKEQKELVAGSMEAGDSLDVLKAAVDRDENAAVAIKEEAAALSESGDRNGALEKYREALEEGLDTAEIHYQTAVIYEDRGMHDRAIEEYKKVLDAGKFEDEPYRERAYAALAGLYKMLDMRVEERDLHESRAGSLVKELEEKKKELAARERNGEAPGALKSLREDIRSLAGKADEAVKNAMRIEPDYGTVLTLKARVLAMRAELADDEGRASTLRNEALKICNSVLFLSDITWRSWLYFSIFARSRKWKVIDAKKCEKEARVLRASIYDDLSKTDRSYRKKAYKEAVRAAKLGVNSAEMYRISADNLSRKDIVVDQYLKSLGKSVLSLETAFVITGLLLIFFPGAVTLFLFEKYMAGLKLAIILTALINGFTIIRSEWTGAYKKQVREYLASAAEAEPGNSELNDRLYDLIADMGDHEGLAEQIGKEEGAIKGDRTKKARLAILTKKRVLAQLKSKQAKIKRWYRFGGTDETVQEIREMIKEAEAELEETGIDAETQAEIDALRDRMLKGRISRARWHRFLYWSRIYSGKYRKIHAEMRNKHMFRYACILDDRGRLAEAERKIASLINDGATGDDIIREAKKELSENYRRQAEEINAELSPENRDRAVGLLSLSLYYDPENTEARLMRGILHIRDPGLEGFGVSDIEGALGKDDSSERAKEARGLLESYYRKTGKYEKAAETERRNREKLGEQKSDAAKSASINALDIHGRVVDIIKDIEEWAEKKGVIEKLKRTRDRVGVVYAARLTVEINELEEALEEPLAGVRGDAELIVRLIEEASRYAESGETEKAVNILAAVSASTNDPVAALLAAEIRERAGEAEKAAAILKTLSGNDKRALAEKNKLRLSLLEARLRSGSGKEEKILEGFDILMDMIERGLLYDLDSAERWVQTFGEMVKAFRLWQKEDDTKDDPVKTGVLIGRIEAVLRSLHDRSGRGFNYRVTQAPDLMTRLSGIVLSEDMPFVPVHIIERLLMPQDAVILDAERAPIFEAVNNMLWKAVTDGEDIREYERFFGHWKKRDRCFRISCNRGLGLIFISRERLWRARWYLGRKGYKEKDIRAFTAYIKAGKYEVSGYRWWQFVKRVKRNIAIRFYKKALKGGFLETKINLRLAGLLSEKHEYDKSFGYYEKAYGSSGDESEKEDIKKKWVGAFKDKISRWRVWWFSLNKSKKAQTVIDDIERYMKIAGEEALADEEPGFLRDTLEKLDRAYRIIERYYHGGWTVSMIRWAIGAEYPRVPEEEKIRWMWVKGRMYLALGDIEKARHLFEDILAIKENDERGLLGLRDCELKSAGEEYRDKAILYHEQALASGSQMARQKNRDMSRVYADKAGTGRDTVIRMFLTGKPLVITPLGCMERAVELDPDNNALQIMLADKYYGDGQIGKAGDILGKYRSREKGFEELRKKLREDGLDTAEINRIVKKAGTLSDRISGRKIEDDALRDKITGTYPVEGGAGRYVSAVVSLARTETEINELEGIRSRIHGERGSADAEKIRQWIEEIIKLMAPGKAGQEKKRISGLPENKKIDEIIKLIENRIIELENAGTTRERYLAGIDITGQKAPVINRLLHAAREELSAGKPAGALNILKRVETISPRGARILLLEADCHVKLGEYGKARTLYIRLAGWKNVPVRFDARIGLINLERSGYDRDAEAYRSDEGISDTERKRKVNDRRRTCDDNIASIVNDMAERELGSIEELEGNDRIAILTEFTRQLRQVIQVYHDRKDIDGILSLSEKVLGILGFDKAMGKVDHEEYAAVMDLVLSNMNRVLKSRELSPLLEDDNAHFIRLLEFLDHAAAYTHSRETLEGLLDLYLLTSGRHDDLLTAILSTRERTHTREQMSVVLKVLNRQLLKENDRILGGRLKDVADFYTGYLGSYEAEYYRPRDLIEALHKGLGIACYRLGDYAGAVTHLNKAGTSLETRFYLVNARIRRAKGPLLSYQVFRARWTASRMWYQSAQSLYTEEALKFTGFMGILFLFGFMNIANLVNAFSWSAPVWMKAGISILTVFSFFLMISKPPFDKGTGAPPAAGKSGSDKGPDGVAGDASSGVDGTVKSRPKKTDPVRELAKRRGEMEREEKKRKKEARKAEKVSRKKNGPVAEEISGGSGMEPSVRDREDIEEGVREMRAKREAAEREMQAARAREADAAREMHAKREEAEREMRADKEKREESSRAGREKREADVAEMRKRMRGETGDGYATLKSPGQRGPGEEPGMDASIVIGVVGADDGDIKEFSSSDPGIMFIRSDDNTGLEETLKEVPDAKIRIMVDVPGRDMEDAVRQAVRHARRQAFIVKYPYLAGLDSVSVKKMNDSMLEHAIQRIIDSLPEETASGHLLDELINSYLSGVPVPGEGTVPLSAEDQERVVRDSKDILRGLREDQMLSDGQKVKFDELVAKLNSVMSGRDRPEINGTLSDFENTAMARTLEEESVIMIRELRSAGLMRTQQAIVIDARMDPAESGYDVSYMRESILNLASKDKELNICIIAPDNRFDDVIAPKDRPDNIIIIPSVGDDIAGSISGYIGRDVTLSDVAIATGEGFLKMVSDHIEGSMAMDPSGTGTAGFVVAGRPVDGEDGHLKARVSRLIPAMLAMNLIDRIHDPENRPNVKVIGGTGGLFEKLLAFKNIVLERIERLDLTEWLVEYMNSLQQVATAV